MWARSLLLLRSASVSGSSHLKEVPLGEQCLRRWRPALKFSYSTSSEAKPVPDPMQTVVLNESGDPAPYTLTKDQEVVITQNDPLKDAKLCELMLKLYIKKEQGEYLPEEVRLEDLRVMLDLGQTQLSKMLRYLHSRDSSRKKSIEQKEERERTMRFVREDRAKAVSEMEIPWLHYSLHCNSIFPRIYKRTINKFSDAYVGKAIHEGQKVIIDCSYESEMDETRIKHTAKQIIFCHTFNRNDRRPFSLHICNLNRDSRLMYYIRRLHPGFEIDTPVGLHSGSYLDIFDRKKLVYLTPHTKNTVKYNPDDIYIMGALVDKHIGLALSNKKAAKEKIRYASLPLDQHLKWKQGAKSLCIHHVFQTLLTVKNTGDWEKAVRESVPKRKVYDEFEEGNIAQFSRRH